MQRLTILLKSCIENYQNVCEVIAHVQAEIEKILVVHSKKPVPGLGQAVQRLGKVLYFQRNPDLLVCYLAMPALIKNNAKMSSALEAIKNNIDRIIRAVEKDLLEDYYAHFSIPILNEFGRLFDERIKQSRVRIKQLQNEKEILIKSIQGDLQKEVPEAMAEVREYENAKYRLRQAKAVLIENQKNIYAELKQLSQAIEDMKVGFGKPVKYNIKEGIKRSLASHLRINYFKWLHPVAELETLLGTISRIDLGDLNQITSDSIPAIELLLMQNHKMVQSLLALKKWIADEQITANYFQSQVNKKEDALYSRLLSQSNIEANIEAQLEPIAKRYSDAYHAMLAAIRSEYDELYWVREDNIHRINNIIPAIIRDVDERIRIKRREESHKNERRHFDERNYALVNAECFQKLKNAYLNTGTARLTLAKLQAHAQGHERKGELINRFIEAVKNTENLEELQNCHEYAIHAPELMDCKTEIGRTFGAQSTTGRLLKQLHHNFESLLTRERENYFIFNSISASIREEKCNYLRTNVENGIDYLQKEFLERIKMFCDRKELESLKEELIYISIWPGSNDAKRTRMSLAIDNTITILSRENRRDSAVQVLYGFGLEKKLQDRRYHYNAFPFSARYQALRSLLAHTATNRPVDTLWRELDGIASQSLAEDRKVDRMREIILGFYENIRRSRFGSEGLFFGKGSRLGDALEKFLTEEWGLNLRNEYVPHRMASDLICSPRFFANFLMSIGPLSCLIDAGSVPFFEMIVIWV